VVFAGTFLIATSCFWAWNHVSRLLCDQKETQHCIEGFFMTSENCGFLFDDEHAVAGGDRDGSARKHGKWRRPARDGIASADNPQDTPTSATFRVIRRPKAALYDVSVADCAKSP
jgi:hypothetical protein